MHCFSGDIRKVEIIEDGQIVAQYVFDEAGNKRQYCYLLGNNTRDHFYFYKKNSLVAHYYSWAYSDYTTYESNETGQLACAKTYRRLASLSFDEQGNFFNKYTFSTKTIDTVDFNKVLEKYLVPKNLKYITGYTYNRKGKIKQECMTDVNFETASKMALSGNKTRRSYTKYYYNSEGMLSKETEKEIGAGIFCKSVIRYEYDGQGRLILEVQSSRENGYLFRHKREKQFRQYYYDDNGLVKKELTYNENKEKYLKVIENVYDVNGRFVEKWKYSLMRIQDGSLTSPECKGSLVKEKNRQGWISIYHGDFEVNDYSYHESGNVKPIDKYSLRIDEEKMAPENQYEIDRSFFRRDKKKSSQFYKYYYFSEL